MMIKVEIIVPILLKLEKDWVDYGVSKFMLYQSKNMAGINNFSVPD